MIHSSPFTDYGHDIRRIESILSQKVDQHEIHSANRNVDSLEHSLRQARSEIDGLRAQCEELQEIVRIMRELLNV